MKLWLLILFLPLFGFGQIVVDSYPTGDDAQANLQVTAAQIRGQSFSCTKDVILDSLKFKLWKNGSPVGAMYGEIYAHSGTYGTSSTGTGSALATSESIDANTLGGIPGVFKKFVFTGANKIKLFASTYYCAVVRTTTGDGVNYIKMRINASSGAGHAGNHMKKTGAIWGYDASYDAVFYVYGHTATGDIFLWTNF